MFISIIIPTHNRALYLAKCCKSINDQIKADSGSEVIVADNGSDNENAIINSQICKDYNFRYLYCENSGRALARNAGIAASNCKSDWVVFIDDDTIVDESWYISMVNVLRKLSDDVVGVEGRVEGSGDGVWDREVQNISGGAFLTCHLAIRKSVLIDIGGLDQYFDKFGYGEDHELAARLMEKGKIIFNTDATVIHLPREVNLFKYLLDSPNRINKSIGSEYYFYKKHPGKYHVFRYAKDFWGTYRSILFKNIYRNIKRRSFQRLTKKPWQSFFLIAASLFEQIWAWFLLIPILNMEINNSRKHKS